MPFARRPRTQTLTSLSDIAPTPFWLDDPSRPDPAPALTASRGAHACLAIRVGIHAVHEADAIHNATDGRASRPARIAARRAAGGASAVAAAGAGIPAHTARAGQPTLALARLRARRAARPRRRSTVAAG